jgi:medium-chain acyl-[acyl-carrier-protein] hydrolase
LLAFAPAGAGATRFRRWSAFLPRDIDVCPVQLPGHETRLNEVPLDDAELMVTAIVDALGPCFVRPYALFGHSLGAQLAFSVAHEIQRRGYVPPLLAAVSASPPPFDPPDHPDRPSWSDERLGRYVARLGGVPGVLLQDRDMFQYTLGLLRADFALSDSLRARRTSPVGTSIVSFAGDRDPGAPPAMMARWREATTAEFELHVMPGDHFFVNDDTIARDVVRTALRRVLPP